MFCGKPLAPEQDVGADHNSAACGARAGPELGQSEEDPEKALSDHLEVATPIAKVRVVQVREDRSNAFDRMKDRPFSSEALACDQPS